MSFLINWISHTLFYLISFGKNIVLHFQVITRCFSFGQIFKLLLVLCRQGLPSLVFGELPKVVSHVMMPLLVLITTGIHEKIVQGHFALRLVGVMLAHDTHMLSTCHDLHRKTSFPKL